MKAFSLQLGSKSISEDELLKAPEETVKLLAEDFAKENNVITLKQTDSSIMLQWKIQRMLQQLMR